MTTIIPVGRRRGAGFTLVELMVALVIGLVLTLVIVQLFVGSRRTLGTTDDVARMQENARFVTGLLTRAVHQAGYPTAPNVGVKVVFEAPKLAIEGTAGAGAVPDSLTVRFQGNGDAGMADNDDRIVTNCVGERVLARVMSENLYTVENVARTDPTGTVQIPSFVCRNNLDNFVGVNVLVQDVDNIKILYGEDTNGDTIVDRFVPAGSVTDNFNNVVAIRFAVLFRTPNVAATTQVNTAVYSLNGTTIGPFNDTRARREAVFTVGIRNRSF